MGNTASGSIDANHGPVGRDDLDIHVVELEELLGLRGGGAGHAADFGIERGQVLQGDGGEHAALFAEWQMFFRFERGVQPGRPAAVLRDAALELVHRFDGGIFHHVIDVAAQKGMGMDGVVDGGVDREILLGVDVADMEMLFGQMGAGVGEGDVAAEFVEREIEPAAEAAHQLDRRGARRPLRLLRRRRARAGCGLRR